MKEKRTSELLDILNSIDNKNNLTKYITKAKLNYNSLDFNNYFEELLNMKNLKKSTIIEFSNLDRTYAYQILNGKKKPSRDKILQLCIAANLNFDEVQKCLTLGNVGQLYAKSPRDSAIIFGIKNNISLIDINNLLNDLNLDLLGE